MTLFPYTTLFRSARRRRREQREDGQQRRENAGGRKIFNSHFFHSYYHLINSMPKYRSRPEGLRPRLKTDSSNLSHGARERTRPGGHGETGALREKTGQVLIWRLEFIEGGNDEKLRSEP
jgi:hypothetical protein